MKKNNKVSFKLEQKKVAIPASMVAILILIAVGNQTLITQGEQSDAEQSRNIATIAKSLRFDNAQTEWEQRLAKELSQSGNRDVASIGAMPNPMDQLRFGILEGKYALHLENGKIQDLEFIETPNSQDRPKYLKDSLSFMKEHASLFAIQFAKVEMRSVEAKGIERVEYLNLLDNQSKVQGHAEFVLDEYGRLKSMKLIKAE